MKKLVLALAAVAAFSGSALAADLPARTYSKAPAFIEPTPSWTGFYFFGGIGGGVWDAKNNTVNSVGVPLTNDVRLGGDGWFGTVGAGYDWQFSGDWVAGIFADGQFGSLKGSINNENVGLAGSEKLRDTYSAGVRLGYLVAPTVYSYVNAGYTGSDWSGSSLGSVFGGAATVTTPSFHRDGFFVGGGVENKLALFSFFGPNWFMKTEYRAAYFDRITLPETAIPTGLLTGNSDTFKPFVQTISTSLVYRFNWTGPVVSKY